MEGEGLRCLAHARSEEIVKAFIVCLCFLGAVGCKKVERIEKKASFYFGTEKIECALNYDSLRNCGFIFFCKDGRHFECVTNVRID